MFKRALVHSTRMLCASSWVGAEAHGEAKTSTTQATKWRTCSDEHVQHVSSTWVHAPVRDLGLREGSDRYVSPSRVKMLSSCMRRYSTPHSTTPRPRPNHHHNFPTPSLQSGTPTHRYKPGRTACHTMHQTLRQKIPRGKTLPHPTRPTSNDVHATYFVRTTPFVHTT